MENNGLKECVLGLHFVFECQRKKYILYICIRTVFIITRRCLVSFLKSCSLILSIFSLKIRSTEVTESLRFIVHVFYRVQIHRPAFFKARFLGSSVPTACKNF